MTDQNNLARDYSSDVADDDPLAELARIVSGQPVKPAASFKPKSFADIARAKTGELQAMAEKQASELQAAELQAAAERQAAELRQKAVAARQPDIEEALMRELGFSMGAEPEPRHEAPAFEPPVAQDQDLPVHFEPEAYPEPEAQAPAAPELSLEDQLMAELMADEAAPADVYAEIWTEPAAPAAVENSAGPFADIHEESFAEFRADAADWRTIDPQDEIAAEFEHDAGAEMQPHGGAAQDIEAYLPELSYDELLAEAQEEASPEASDGGVASRADFVGDFQSSFEQEFESRFADSRTDAPPTAGIAAAHEARGRDYALGAVRESAEAATERSRSVAGWNDPQDPASDEFLKDLDAAFVTGDPDPYAIDFTELENATELTHSGPVDQSRPASEEDELFRELAQGVLPGQNRSAAGNAAGAGPLYEATAPLFTAAHESHGVAAGQPAGEADFDDFGFGAALEAEVRQVVENDAAQSRKAPISPRLVEDQFAAAFAEELDMGFEPEEDPRSAVAPYASASQGWQAGETRDANRSFSEMAAPRASAREQYDAAEASYGEAAAYDDEYLQDDPGYEQTPDVAAVPAGGRAARRGFMLAASALGLALLLGGGALAYGYLSGSVTSVAGNESAPVIKADAGPVKVKPEEPGGAEVQNQDKAVYERVAGRGGVVGDQETLISTSEEPVDVAALAAEEVPLAQEEAAADTVGEAASPLPLAPAVSTDGDAAASELGAKAEERLTPGAAPVQPEAQAQAALAPRRVRTVVVTPDGKIIARPDPEPASTAVTAPVETAFAPAPQPAQPEAVAALAPGGAQPAEPVKADPAAQAKPEQPAVQAEQAPEQRQPVEIAKAEPVSAPAAPTAAPWAVQLASQRSAEDAQATFQNLRQKFPDILGNRALAVQRADVEGKGTFFRVRLPAQTKAEAAQICEQLKVAGGSCFVTR